MYKKIIIITSLLLLTVPLYTGDNQSWIKTAGKWIQKKMGLGKSKTYPMEAQTTVAMTVNLRPAITSDNNNNISDTIIYATAATGTAVTDTSFDEGSKAEDKDIPVYSQLYSQPKKKLQRTQTKYTPVEEKPKGFDIHTDQDTGVYGTMKKQESTEDLSTRTVPQYILKKTKFSDYGDTVTVESNDAEHSRYIIPLENSNNDGDEENYVPPNALRQASQKQFKKLPTPPDSPKASSTKQSSPQPIKTKTPEQKRKPAHELETEHLYMDSGLFEQIPLPPEPQRHPSTETKTAPPKKETGKKNRKK